MTTHIKHIGFIMDGNRRWAKAHGFSVSKGHADGYAHAKDVVRWCKEAKIPAVTLYAFSTENWKRSRIEVNFLLSLFERVLTKKIDELLKEGARIRIIGNKERFSPKLEKAIMSAEKKTAHNKGIVVHIAFNYGGRDEIVRAVSEIAKRRPKIITEKTVASYLDTSGIPDPDLIIRTGGEQRLSGFLLWQSAYAELYFTKTYWPAFSKKEFLQIISDVKKRQRRFGS